MDDDLIADLPARDLRAHRPDDAGRIAARDVIGILVTVNRRDRRAEASPHTVVIDARRHHENQHIVAVELPSRHAFAHHRIFWRAMTLFAYGPGVHLGRHMTERRNLADLVKILVYGELWLGCGRCSHDDPRSCAPN